MVRGQDLPQMIEIVVRPLGDIGIDGDFAEARMLHYVRVLGGL